MADFKGRSEPDVYELQRENAFWFRVDKRGEDECWEWLGWRDDFGRGRFKFRGKNVLPHRYAYELLVGDIPTDMLVCHTCDNGSCVNPKHLFLGTHMDNIHDMIRKGRARFNGKPHKQ